MSTHTSNFAKRRARVRKSVGKGTSERPRLSVHRSSMHIYAQIINDTEGKTLVAASSLDKNLRTTLKTGADKMAAIEVGKLVAQRALKAGINSVVFDRGGFLYHGRVEALANAAREGGLKF
ncbi:MAG: 50S ribosomal protein L18 [Hyphomicrobium sp.]